MKNKKTARCAIVGQAFNTSHENPLSSYMLSSWKRAFNQPKNSTRVLLFWLNISYYQFIVLFNTYNIFNRLGEKIPTSLKRKIIEGHDVILLVGKIAIREMLGSFYQNISLPAKVGEKFYFFPHPSGRNRILNDLNVRKKCRRLGRQVSSLLYLS